MVTFSKGWKKVSRRSFRDSLYTQCLTKSAIMCDGKLKADSEQEEMTLEDRIAQDARHFTKLLDLVPPSAYFSPEERQELWGNEQIRKRKKKSLSGMTVSQITELRQQGKTLTSLNHNKKKSKASIEQEDEEDEAYSKDAKHQGKKHSRTGHSKHKQKELERRAHRLEELRQRLQDKVAAIKAQKSGGQPVNSQEVKRLRRQEKKVNAKLKNKKAKGSAERPAVAAGLQSPPHPQILNHAGQPVKSKFDFSIISTGDKEKQGSTGLQGRDYRRLLEKVERRREKVERVKEQDAEKGAKLEERQQWQAAMGRAQGGKVKDDPMLLKKAAKRKDKIKEQKKRKWGDRAKTVEQQQKKKLDRRNANIEKRKTDKKDKKKKQLIKRGRIIPGFQ